ncbi:MAG: glycosyltransferase family 4 protein [Rhodobacterales bacterium]|nr:glycosyltransferase family 4 protein [Rhodobacterales bacterium]
MTRILMTLDAVGGVWRYALDLGRGLRGRGYDVTFAGFGPPPTEAQRDEALAVGRLDWCDAPLEWMAAEMDDLRDVPRQIEALALRHRVDLLHLNLPSQAAGLSVDLPVVTVSHSCVATWFAAVRGSALPEDWQWQARLTLAGFKAADAVVAPSRAHADALAACHGRIDGLHVVHNASLAPKTSEPVRADVAAAGRWWDEGKDAATLDRAAAQIAWPVRMAGPLRGENGAQVALRYADGLGRLPHHDALALVQGAGVLVSPSLYEPFGLVVAEAARAGVPLVLSDIPTYRELWDGAVFFFAPRDADGLASAVNRLIRDRPLRDQMGAAARTRAARYDLAAQVAAMAAIYDRVCVSRHALMEVR